ncbi:hypothetical protein CK203_052461 [Vitis vinifera]|uniref:Uncharacterized protein n=1 Tax=Vitis vinifera TaxID=29760 RepID=A0A438HCD1_VITVI|nr:hypothetical protein CK203_052461 [Vitis vinifera]
MPLSQALQKLTEARCFPLMGSNTKSLSLMHLAMARASHLAFVIQGEFGDLDIKYLKQNISKCRSQISGSFRRTPRHCAKWLQNSLGERYQRIQICLTGEVETPSSPIRRQAPDAKYPDRMSTEKNSGCGISREFGTSQGGRMRVHGVGTPPPDDTERASLSRAIPSGFPKRTRDALPYPDSLMEKHPTLAIITTRTIAYPIQIYLLMAKDFKASVLHVSELSIALPWIPKNSPQSWIALDLIDQGLVHLGQPSVTTNLLPAHTTHAVPPPADGIHFLEFSNLDDHIHMLSWDDTKPELVVSNGIYEMDGATLGLGCPLYSDYFPRQH